MSLLGGDTPRETAIAWTFVLVQFALPAAILLLPSGDAWLLPAWLASAARWTGLAGMAVLILGAVGLGRSLTVWLAVKARWEEDQLRRRYPSYDTYARGTPRFVPGWPLGEDRHG